MEAIDLHVNKDSKLLKKSVIEIINAKIEKVNLQLKAFILELTVPDQTPGRPDNKDFNSALAQKIVFDRIEKSSLLTSKLYCLRANVTDSNSEKILQLLSSSKFESLALQRLKDEFR